MPVICSLHPLDVSVLEGAIRAILEGEWPDLCPWIARRRQHDVLRCWSQRLRTALQPYADRIAHDRWLLCTAYRPLFLTSDNVVERLEQLFAAPSHEAIATIFFQEVKALLPMEAEEIVQQVLHSMETEIFPNGEEIRESLQGYLAMQHDTWQYLLGEEQSYTSSTYGRFAQLCCWRSCTLLSDLHPSWITGKLSLTHLAQHKPECIAWLADPRGLFHHFGARRPGIRWYMPYYLDETPSTGLCIPADMVAEWQGWCQEQLAHAASPELHALLDALHYARHYGVGLWEANGIFTSTLERMPIITQDITSREEQLPFLTCLPWPQPQILEKEVDPMAKLETEQTLSEENVQAVVNAAELAAQDNETLPAAPEEEQVVQPPEVVDDEEENELEIREEPRQEEETIVDTGKRIEEPPVVNEPSTVEKPSVDLTNHQQFLQRLEIMGGMPPPEHSREMTETTPRNTSWWKMMFDRSKPSKKQQR